MKAADIRTMTVDQIDDEVLKLKKEQFNLRFQRATGQLENTSRVRVVRRDIARLQTIARQKRAGEPGAVRAASAKPQQAPKPKAAPKTKTDKTKTEKTAAKPKRQSAKSKAKSKSKK